METHGGIGQIYKQCYIGIEDGVVFEKDARKAVVLGRQRPTWAVYEADCVSAIEAGAGSHLPVNFLDVDPYGDPWPVIEAFFSSDRPRPNKMVVVVNDGLRQKIEMGGARDVGSLHGVVSQLGNDFHGVYLDVCQRLMIEKAVQAGFTLDRFAGYYCGHAKQMTHYLAILSK